MKTKCNYLQTSYNHILFIFINMARASEKKTLFPQIVKQFLNNFPQRKIVETFNISSSTVHNIKRLRESGEISVRKGSRPKIGIRCL